MYLLSKIPLLWGKIGRLGYTAFDDLPGTKTTQGIGGIC